MAHKLFIDVNIILDYTLQRKKWNNNARKIFVSIVEGKFEAIISAVTVHISSHILKKHLGADTAKQIILALINDVEVVSTPHEVVIQAMSSDWTDIEDAIQYYTALHHRADLFITRDGGLLNKSTPSLPVINPNTFTQTYL